ncbi:co-chaperone HscB [Ferrimonas aestuarii]|uniref:Co-chaperone protein HscB homolog n=1 Tax=Ferrimonas aestuarii TaxID=2569539 RepID=A0A4U1BMI2_9GAMM|nr:co-chaperone HscB [Ferrimonas aestuarii]TKB54738.1 co-chaperone HscB [Ferrimonas aestuarii]
MNYFELFNLPAAFSVDLSAISEHYRELQRTVHPDNFADASERERLLSVQKAAEINDAFQTLKDPILRAQYLLKLNGVELMGETQTIKDTSFLMQQMMLRESLEEVEHASDPESAAMDFADELAGLTKALMQQMQQQLAEHQWQTAADSVRKLKFMKKLEEELVQLEDKLLA